MKIKRSKGSVSISKDGHISSKVSKNNKKIVVNPKTAKSLPPREYSRVHLGENVLVFEPEEEGDR